MDGNINNQNTEIESNPLRSERIKVIMNECTSNLVEACGLIIEDKYSERMKTMFEENEKSKQKIEALEITNRNILKRLELLEYGDQFIPRALSSMNDVNIPIPVSNSQCSTARDPQIEITKPMNKNIVETEIQSDDENLPGSLESNGDGSLTVTGAGIEYRLIGTKEDFVEFIGIPAADPLKIFLVELQFVNLEIQPLIQYLETCKNLKILRLMQVNLFDNIEGKIQLKHLQEFQLHRVQYQDINMFKEITSTVEGLSSQIFFYKENMEQNFFTLNKSFISFKFGEKWIFEVDPIRQKFVSNLKATPELLYDFADNKPFPLKQLALSKCEIELDKVEPIMLPLRDLSLNCVKFIKNEIYLDINDLFCKMRQLNKLLLWNPNAYLDQSTLPAATLKELNLDIPQIENRNRTNIFLERLSINKISSNIISQAKLSPRHIVINGSGENSYSCYIFLESLLKGNPVFNRTKWIWIQRLENSRYELINQYPYAPVNKFLHDNNIIDFCKDFVIERDSEFKFTATATTEEQRMQLSSEYMPSFSSFLDYKIKV